MARGALHQNRNHLFEQLPRGVKNKQPDEYQNNRRCGLK
jgi:hypothetical protein